MDLATGPSVATGIGAATEQAARVSAPGVEVVGGGEPDSSNRSSKRVPNTDDRTTRPGLNFGPNTRRTSVRSPDMFGRRKGTGDEHTSETARELRSESRLDDGGEHDPLAALRAAADGGASIMDWMDMTDCPAIAAIADAGRPLMVLPTGPPSRRRAGWMFRNRSTQDRGPTGRKPMDLKKLLMVHRNGAR